MAKITSSNYDTLLQVIKSSFVETLLTIEGLKDFMIRMPTVAATTAAEELSRLLPFIGALIAGSLSFGTTYFTLNYILNKMEEIALEIVKVASGSIGAEQNNENND